MMTHRSHMLVVLAFALVGCGARMAVPADVAAGAEELHVEGRSLLAGGLFGKGDFKIGDYEVTDLAYGGSGATRYATFSGYRVDDEGTVAFGVKTATGSLRGTCVAEASESTTQFTRADLKRTTGRYACACGDESAPVAQLELVLAAPGVGIQGTLRANGADFRVKALYDLEGAGPSADPSGYRIDGAEGVGGAVDVLGKGRAWMKGSLDPAERLGLACLFAGLFAYRPPSSGAPPATQ
jgi:hypothetical protein